MFYFSLFVRNGLKITMELMCSHLWLCVTSGSETQYCSLLFNYCRLNLGAGKIIV